MDVTSVGSTLLATGAATVGAGSVSVGSPVAGSPSQVGSTSSTKVAASVQPPTTSQVNQAVKQINNSLVQKSQNIYATLGTDKATGIEVVKIVDKSTNETIVQYPSKSALAVAQSIQQSQDSVGQLINTKS